MMTYLTFYPFQISHCIQQKRESRRTQVVQSNIFGLFKIFLRVVHHILHIIHILFASVRLENKGIGYVDYLFN